MGGGCDGGGVLGGDEDPKLTSDVGSGLREKSRLNVEVRRYVGLFPTF